MIAVDFEPTFEGWRIAARKLLAAHVPPGDVLWGDQTGSTLFSDPIPCASDVVRVPKAFIKDAHLIALHREFQRWTVLYRVLYRLTHGEPYLLELHSDSDIRTFHSMRKSVTHDWHQMKAFVRFREQDGRYVAWYQPDHFIVEALAPWFAKRFAAMRWSILTPDRCAHWDLRSLTFSDGVLRSAAPETDTLEDLWRAYYASTFNPSRVNIDLMRQHMPERRWQALPESQLIHELARESAGREQRMISSPALSASAFIPPGADLPVLRAAIHQCRGCELWEHATQPVFGQGPPNARIVLVGEQPGDKEDREGKPFAGPAGQLLDRALSDAGLRREHAYITGAVKHFRYEQRGRNRIHKTATKAQVAACQPWLEAELDAIRPDVIVAMGNTAVLSVVGRGFRLREERGVVLPHRTARGVVATVHPSFILRIPDPARQAEEYSKLVTDIRTARAFAESCKAA